MPQGHVVRAGRHGEREVAQRLRHHSAVAQQQAAAGGHDGGGVGGVAQFHHHPIHHREIPGKGHHAGRGRFAATAHVRIAERGVRLHQGHQAQGAEAVVHQAGTGGIRAFEEGAHQQHGRAILVHLPIAIIVDAVAA